MAAKIISVLAQKYGFDADEATTYYNDYKSEAGSATSISTVQRAENAIAKTQEAIDELKAKIPSKKGKQLTNANEKLEKLQEKLADQLKKLEVKKEKAEKAKAPKKPKVPKTPKAPKADASDKRIKRMSPTLTKQLTAAFLDAKKEFKKEDGQRFAKYVNELTKDDFEAKNLADHMRDFAGVGAKVEPPKEVEFKVRDFARLKVKHAPVNNTEPEYDPDEDVVEVEFNGKTYHVGEISKRVYLENEDGVDEYQDCCLGMGKFKGMKMPA